MLWSLLKILVFVGIVVALSWGAGWFMSNGSQLRVIGYGMEFTLTPLVTIVAALVLLAAVWLILRAAGLTVALLRFLNGDDTALSRYFDRNRERRGFKALADGLMAVSAGEGKLAMAKAAKAEKYLGRPELTNLITAQAAEMSGDRSRAEATYKKLLQDDSTRFVGIRGILKQKLEDGDTDTALKLAEKAFALKPKHAEMQDTLLQLQAQGQDWTGARKTLSAKLRYGSLPRDVHRRRDAVLALSESMEQTVEGQDTEASANAIEANRLSPHLVPAAVLAARAHIREGKPKYAARVIRAAWDHEPHPELAAAFAEIEPDE
ncbi:MAG: heme biosynthesis HemY N-terminal domain-containing protein, partial [Pseudomonadota bacterium]